MKITESDRLYIRELSQEDLLQLTEILSDPEVMKHSVGGVHDKLATARFIDWCMSCYSTRGFGPWALDDKESGELVGFCGISPEVIDSFEEINLGRL
ncbi:GNAT family N-acetyltransferase, partial [Hahella ganghwensis]|uniref:GNAT family N-acetyltransferase n=1 Tax=Hahella ganghwensis TaxID=286420 RepID=UPI0003A92B17